MNKLICAHCGRNQYLGYYDYKTKSGAVVAVVYLCDVCKSFMKSIDLNFTIDDEKVQQMKKAMKLNKERIAEKQPETEEKC